MSFKFINFMEMHEPYETVSHGDEIFDFIDKIKPGKNSEYQLTERSLLPFVWKKYLWKNKYGSDQAVKKAVSEILKRIKK